jgi:hypothetical protein
MNHRRLLSVRLAKEKRCIGCNLRSTLNRGFQGARCSRISFGDIFDDLGELIPGAQCPDNRQCHACFARRRSSAATIIASISAIT